ncbi:MAG: hypothetical protein ABI162_02360 [Luteolibacter sp.]
MPSRHTLALVFVIASALPAVAESRPWKSADGLHSIVGDFLKRDATSVTIRREDGKEVSFDLGKLHADDKKWLDANHPLAATDIPDDSAVFDTLKFGDKHDMVLAKLKASKLVVMTIADNLIGRTGLNGIFRIRQKVGGQDASLYFDWTEADTLKEINVRTAAFPATSYDAKLAPSWKEFIELLTTLHGKPLQAVPQIDLASIPESSMLSSHLWRLESGGSALLGIGREGGKYQVVVRFTQEKIQPAGYTSNPGPQIDFEP